MRRRATPMRDFAGHRAISASRAAASSRACRLHSTARRVSPKGQAVTFTRQFGGRIPLVPFNSRLWEEPSRRVSSRWGTCGCPRRQRGRDEGPGGWATPASRLLTFLAGIAVLAGVLSGPLAWCWTQSACLLDLRAPMPLSASDVTQTMWHPLADDVASTAARRLERFAVAFPTAAERAAAPAAWAYVAVAICFLGGPGLGGWRLHRQVRYRRAGSPLGKERQTLARHGSTGDRCAGEHGRCGQTSDGCGCPARCQVAPSSA
jgi:hypothetical protein